MLQLPLGKSNVFSSLDVSTIVGQSASRLVEVRCGAVRCGAVPAGSVSASQCSRAWFVDRQSSCPIMKGGKRQSRALCKDETSASARCEVRMGDLRDLT